MIDEKIRDGVRALRRRAAITLLILLLTGCAELPTGAAIGNSTLVTFTMTMQQPINPAFTYVIALNPSTSANPTEQGPVPVISPPWGNGIVGGNSPYIILWNFNNPPALQAQIYTLATPNAEPSPTAYVPINFSVSADQMTLTAEIALTEIAPTTAVAQSYQSLQVNLLTMSIVPTANYNGPRIEDALGNQGNPSTINSYITIPLNTAGTYNNTRYGNQLANPNWVSDPTLDITNFSVVVSPQ